MREIDYTDDRGRKHRVKLPDGADDSEAPYGITIGPMINVDELELPEPQATRLHNELHARGIWTFKQVRKNNQAVFAALQAAFHIDVTTICNAYAQLESGG